MSASDQNLPIFGGPEKRAYVQSMFGAIAPTYDRLNRIISFNLDQRWRRRAVATLDWEKRPGGTYLDLCAGTMDFSLMLATQPGFSGEVVAADFAIPMLKAGRQKKGAAQGVRASGRPSVQASRRPSVLPVGADALVLPFASERFDGLTVGWGMRNLVDLDAGLREIARVLRPGARLAILEMSQPAWKPFGALVDFYFDHLLPRIGRAISKHRTAYSWLPESTRVLPGPAPLADRIRAAGFDDVRYELLLGGSCALHTGKRREARGERSA